MYKGLLIHVHIFSVLVKTEKPQSEVLKIHAEITPILMVNGCYAFSTGHIRRRLIFLLSYFALFPQQQTRYFLSVYFYYLILILVSSESGSLTALHGSQKGTH